MSLSKVKGRSIRIKFDDRATFQLSKAQKLYYATVCTVQFRFGTNTTVLIPISLMITDILYVKKKISRIFDVFSRVRQPTAMVLSILIYHRNPS